MTVSISAQVNTNLTSVIVNSSANEYKISTRIYSFENRRIHLMNAFPDTDDRSQTARESQEWMAYPFYCTMNFSLRTLTIHALLTPRVF